MKKNQEREREHKMSHMPIFLHPHRSSLQKVSCMFQCLTSCPLHLYFVVIRFLSASNQDQHTSRFWYHLVTVSMITISFPAKPYRHQRASGLRHHWCHLHTSEWRSPGPSVPSRSAPGGNKRSVLVDTGISRMMNKSYMYTVVLLGFGKREPKGHSQSLKHPCSGQPHSIL